MHYETVKSARLKKCFKNDTLESLATNNFTPNISV